MASTLLRVVGNSMPDPPYPACTRARGWRFEIDLEQVKASKTWGKTPAELRPWLLMLWVESWGRIPVGTWEDDDAAIAGHIGMPLTLFQMHRDTLMTNWRPHSDGLLYHPVVTERVLALLHVRNGEKKRQADHRAKIQADALRVSHAGVTRDSRVSTPLIPIPSTEDLSQRLSSPTKVGSGCPDCPHQEILAAWHEVLPNFPAIATWDEERQTPMRARWRDRFVAGKYANTEEGLTYWRRVFEVIGQSDFLSGKSSDRGWQCTLPWFIKRANFAKFLDGDYKNRK